jgi:hypothetical protein
MRIPTTILAAAVAAALAAPAAASASTIGYEGGALVFRALPGEANFVVVDGDDQQVTFTDDYPIALAVVGSRRLADVLCHGRGPRPRARHADAPMSERAAPREPARPLTAPR